MNDEFNEMNEAPETAGQPEKKPASLKLGLWYGLGGALILILIIGGVIMLATKNKNKPADDNTNTATSAQPANLRVTLITKKDCADCFNLNLFIDAIKQNNVADEILTKAAQDPNPQEALKKLVAEEKNVKVQNEDADSATGKKLIEKYKITTLPSLLVAGELEKNPRLTGYWQTESGLGEVVDGVFVFRQPVPPYFDLASNKVVGGNLGAIYLSATSCKECYDVKAYETVLKNSGVNPLKNQAIDADSAEGQALIKQYAIKNVPTIILTGDLSVYGGFQQQWGTYGTLEKDGAFVLRQVIPPFKEVASGAVKGANVGVTYLTVDACKECYQVSTHDAALNALFVYPVKKKTVDIASEEGKALVKKYEIKKAPTIILTGELEVYASFLKVWPQVGSVAKDGAYVLTGVEQMGSYFDLTTNQLVPAGTGLQAQ